MLTAAMTIVISGIVLTVPPLWGDYWSQRLRQESQRLKQDETGKFPPQLFSVNRENWCSLWDTCTINLLTRPCSVQSRSAVIIITAIMTMHEMCRPCTTETKSELRTWAATHKVLKGGTKTQCTKTNKTKKYFLLPRIITSEVSY